MGLSDIPIRDARMQRVLEQDVDVLRQAGPPAFRLERAQLRFEGALRNGLSEREATRLKQLPEPQSALAQWRRGWRRSLTASRTRFAIGVLAAVSTAAASWAVLDSSQRQSSELLTADGQISRYQLEDGSSIVLRPGALGRLSKGDHSVLFELDHGEAEFDVVHHEGELWRVVAQDYEVIVVGTHFTVRYQPASLFVVEVERGMVAVQVPEQETALQLPAGSRLEATRGEVILRHHWRAKREQVETSTDTVQEQGPASARSPIAANEPQPQTAAGATPATQPSPRAGAGQAGKRNARNAAKANELSELRLLGQARNALAAGDYQTALAWIGKHQRRFPQGQLDEEREALRIEALRETGRNREARRAAGEFRERFPKSVLSPQMPTNDP